MARLSVEGDRSIYFENYQPGRGRPVVLVHGWGMSSRVWDGVLPSLLENGNEVVVFDHRCCAMSDKDFADASVAAIASDVVALIDHLGLDGVVVNGWSLGGAVAMAAAGKLGGRCAGLVSTCGAAPRYTQADGWPHGGTEEIVAQTVAALRADRANFLHGLAAGVCHADVGAPTVEWMWQIFMQAGAKADESLLDLGSVDLREVAASLRVPALVVRGDHDAIVPPDIATACADMVPNGRLVPFEGSGHAPFLEEREKYCAELVNFVNGLD